MTTTNTPAVVNEEEFETIAEVVKDQDGWMVGSDAILDPDGNFAVLTPEAQNALSETGHGLIEWLALTGVVALGVLAAFSVFAPIFMEAFQTHILNALP